MELADQYINICLDQGLLLPERLVRENRFEQTPQTGMVSILSIEKVWVPVNVRIVRIPQRVIGEGQTAGLVGVDIWAGRRVDKGEGAGSDADDLAVSGVKD